jgi:hypothetical protein
MTRVARIFTRALVLLCVSFSELASAHPTQFTTLQVMIDDTGRFQATLNIDILSYALGQTSLATSNEELEAVLAEPRPKLGQLLADADARFQREVVIHTDAGDAVPTTWQLPGLPEVNAVLALKIQPPILMPGDISFSGALPAGAHTVSIRLPYVLGDTVQVYELPHGGSYDEQVVAGDYSSDVKVDLSPVKTTSRGWFRNRSVLWKSAIYASALIAITVLVWKARQNFGPGQDARASRSDETR